MKILNDSFLFLLLAFFLVADFAVVFGFGGPVGTSPLPDFLTFAGMFSNSQVSFFREVRFDDFSLADQCYITAKIITARENERERERVTI